MGGGKQGAFPCELPCHSLADPPSLICSVSMYSLFVAHFSHAGNQQDSEPLFFFLFSILDCTIVWCRENIFECFPFHQVFSMTCLSRRLSRAYLSDTLDFYVQCCCCCFTVQSTKILPFLTSPFIYLRWYSLEFCPSLSHHSL